MRMNLITLALELGRTLEEIGEISVEEYNEWLAYYNVREAKNGYSTERKHKNTGTGQ